TINLPLLLFLRSWLHVHKPVSAYHADDRTFAGPAFSTYFKPCPTRHARNPSEFEIFDKVEVESWPSAFAPFTTSGAVATCPSNASWIRSVLTCDIFHLNLSYIIVKQLTLVLAS
ncbi:hypothetical protein B0H11DRAFT_2078099, partial [Mycena galericulata]